MTVRRTAAAAPGNAAATPPPSYNFNWLFLKRFARLHGLMYPRIWSVNFGLLIVFLAACGLEQYLAYRTGIMSGQFFKALGDKSWDDFVVISIINILIVIAISITMSARTLVTNSLIVCWRKGICEYFHSLYLSGYNHYRLNVIDCDIDNPDQRITADVSSLVDAYGSMINKLVVTPFTIAYYTWDAFNRAGWIGPTGMFALFLVSTVLNKMLMRPVITTTVLKERKEGEFRFKHLQVRSNAESLAFHGAPFIEQKKIDEKLHDVCKTQQNLYYKSFGIDVSVKVFAYLGAIASYLVIAVPIFTGSYDNMSGSELSQAISENAFVCIYLISQLSNLAEITGTVASMAGSTHRVCELREKLELYEEDKDNIYKGGGEHRLKDESANSVILDVNDDTRPLDQNNHTPPESIVDNLLKKSETVTDPGVLLEFEEFSLSAPQGEYTTTLIHKLNLTVNIDRNLLIMGPSSSGKSSLLRAIRGLWPPLSGQININRKYVDRTFFLPQRPFFTNGTLREQVFYPRLIEGDDRTSDAEKNILHLLSIAGLSGLVDRCCGLDNVPTWNWYDVLSPGEAQRLAFVRLFCHNPILAILDEATSAISQDVEKILYQECLNRKITLISVGHRDSLKEFHQQMLTLVGSDGEWRLQNDIVYSSRQNIQDAVYSSRQNMEDVN
eukprot:TRINITY_DN4756_c0_g1_i3.p1 TRINITY_DN4756_c0_g1~~TRINITY_DN4756_c0_g1_i3.p1  ORF type:complete len:669 (+),score=140.73 TRINITY_DN4756_c0_g1_i3:147-2153(+)